MNIQLTQAQERAIRCLVEILTRIGTRYQFTGGFAGNLHGSRWPLHDLDLDVPGEDLPLLAEHLLPHTTRPLSRYSDHEFELILLRARIEGVEIDVSQAEDAFAIVGGRALPLNTTLTNRQPMQVAGLEVWVQPLAELIAYKELLGRVADLIELREIQAQPFAGEMVDEP